jgi:hypothetical protein
LIGGILSKDNRAGDERCSDERLRRQHHVQSGLT